MNPIYESPGLNTQGVLLCVLAAQPIDSLPFLTSVPQIKTEKRSRGISKGMVLFKWDCVRYSSTVSVLHKKTPHGFREKDRKPSELWPEKHKDIKISLMSLIGF